MRNINEHFNSAIKFESFSSFNKVNESETNINFDVEYSGDFEGEDPVEKKKVSEWSFTPIPPITVTEVSGSVDTERDNIDIKLSNGDSIQFECFYITGAGNNSKEFAKIIIHEAGEYDAKEHDVKDEFMEHLEQYGSVVLAILECYKDLREFKD